MATPMPNREWLFQGYTNIERFTPDGTELTQIPFELRYREHPGAAAVEAEARNVATDFLAMLQDTAPAHRDDYGEIVGVVFEFIGRVPVGGGPLDIPPV